MHAIFCEKQLRKSLRRQDPETVSLIKAWLLKQLSFRLSLIKRDFKNVAEISPSYFLNHQLDQFANAEQLFLTPQAAENAAQSSLEALPLPLKYFDFINSILLLQFTNDLPGVLKQIYAALKPDGLFQGIMFAGDSLIELTTSLQYAEIEISGGMSAFTIPTITPQDAGMLLQRAGFQLPLIDRERITLYYPNLLSLLKDIQTSGMNAPLYAKGKFSKKILQVAEDHYREHFSNYENKLYATVDVFFLTGWSYDKNQPKALPRGSGKVSLLEVL